MGLLAVPLLYVPSSQVQALPVFSADALYAEQRMQLFSVPPLQVSQEVCHC